MLKKLLSLSLFAAIALPLSASYAIGSYWPVGKTFSSGPYFGAEAGYNLVFNRLTFSPFVGSIHTARRSSRTNHGAASGLFLGYSHFLKTGNLQYLGAEIGGYYRTTYAATSTAIYNRSINAHWQGYIDIMPGLFFDDAKTVLVYGRIGAEIDQYRMAGLTTKKYIPALRAGVGVEHMLTHNFYIRADYVFALPTQKAEFRIAGDGAYRSRPLFNTFSIGIDYRVPNF